MIPKIQTLQEYQQLAARTCPDLGSLQQNRTHMWLGVVTEIGETLDILKKKFAYKKDMDMVNFGEELADQMWYIANDAKLMHVELTMPDKESEVIPTTFEDKFERTIVVFARMLKYQDAWSPNELSLAVQHIAAVWELDFFQLLTNNIAKLMVRYPAKFTEDAALNRNLEAERAELEKTDDKVKEGVTAWFFIPNEIRTVEHAEKVVMSTADLKCSEIIIQKVISIHNHGGDIMDIDAYLLADIGCSQEDREAITEGIHAFLTR